MKSHDLVHELSQTAAVFGRKSEASMIFEGEQAYTDGTQIVLPAIPQGAELSHDTVMVMRGYVDHEAGHLRHTDFETFQKFASTASDQAKAIHNCLEDMWLEKRVMEEYPGAEKNLRKLTEHVSIEEYDNIKANPDTYQKVTADAVCNAILRTGRYDYGGELTQQMFHEMPEKFQAWGKQWDAIAKNAKDTKELCNLALAIEKLLEETPSSAKMNNPDPEDGGKGLEGDPQEFKFDPDGDVTEGKTPSDKKSKGKGKPVDGKGKPMKTKRLAEMVEDLIKSEIDTFFDKDDKGNKSKKYTVLTTRYDEVYEKGKPAIHSSRVKEDMESGQASDYEKIKSKLSGVVNTMKSRLRRALMAKELRDWDYGREYGRLDSKRLVAGVMGSQTIYKARKDRLELDTAVHFLVDLSGSMGGDKIKVACESVIALSECLEGTQIAYQVTGFSNYGGRGGGLAYEAKDSGRSYERVEPLRLHKYKKFNEPLQTAKGTISAISRSAGGNNSDRDAVLWAYKELKARPEKRKILFVLSDGQPSNYTINSRVNLDYALKNAIDECTKSGVECVGIGILTDHVKHLYPKSVSIKEVTDLSGAIFTQLSNLLTGGKVNF
jgi:cobaltochelatase CobT subunit